MHYPGPCPGIRAAYPSKTSWVFEFGLRLKFRMPILMAAAAAASRNAFVGPASLPSHTIARVQQQARIPRPATTTLRGFVMPHVKLHLRPPTLALISVICTVIASHRTSFAQDSPEYIQFLQQNS